MNFWRYGCLLVVTIISFSRDTYSEDDEYEMNPSEDSGNSTVPCMRECIAQANMLQREIDEHKRNVAFSLQQPLCIPVIKRFLKKLLKEVEKLSLPYNVTGDKLYAVKLKVSKQLLVDIQNLLNNKSSWRQYKTWEMHIEDMFQVEPEVSYTVIIIVAIVCIRVWLLVPWSVQFKRVFTVLFVISLLWNWLYLYKTAFDEQQANMLKMESMNDKCTRGKAIDWMDALKGYFDITSTRLHDPCNKYYEVLIVNPILRAPPQEALIMTLTTFIVEPLKHLGVNINMIIKILLELLP